MIRNKKLRTIRYVVEFEPFSDFEYSNEEELKSLLKEFADLINNSISDYAKDKQLYYKIEKK